MGKCGHLIKVNRFWIVRFSNGLMNLYFVDTIRIRFWMFDTLWIQLVLSCRIRLLQKQIKNQGNIYVFALNHWWRWKIMSNTDSKWINTWLLISQVNGISWGITSSLLTKYFIDFYNIQKYTSIQTVLTQFMPQWWINLRFLWLLQVF